MFFFLFVYKIVAPRDSLGSPYLGSRPPKQRARETRPFIRLNSVPKLFDAKICQKGTLDDEKEGLVSQYMYIR